MIAGRKGFLARPRPLGHRLVEAGGYSYPSGHAVSTAVLYADERMSRLRARSEERAAPPPPG